MIRELKIFTGLFLLLSLAMHFTAWFDHPLIHIKALSSAALGVWHPLFITLLAYVLISIVRGLTVMIKKFLQVR